MIPTYNETYICQVYERNENTPYEFSNNIAFYFKCRPASSIEEKKYRIQKGVNGNSDSVYIVASNLPDTLKIGDRVKYLDKIWQVQSVGYYFDNSYIVNGSIMSDEYIISRCPKGVNLQ